MPTRLRTIIQRFTAQRSTRFTSEGWRFLLFTLAVGIAAINTGNNLFYLLLAMMLSIILISGIAAEVCLRRLEFHRHLPDLLYVNEPATATLVVKNCKSMLPSFSLRLFDMSEEHELDRGLVVRQILPGATQMLSYPIIATRRGRLPLEGVSVVTAFPFGLFLKKAYYAVEGDIVVAPLITVLDERIQQDLQSAGHEHGLHRRGHGSDLYNLRLYHAGDDSRSIHWASTARTSKLIVRETEEEDQHRATIHLSPVAPGSRNVVFEEAVSFTASLINHLAMRGYSLRLVVGQASSPFGQGQAHLIDLLRMLALCERRDPAAGDGGGSDNPSMALEGSRDGAFILVRPWSGASVPDHFNHRIDEDDFARMKDGV